MADTSSLRSNVARPRRLGVSLIEVLISTGIIVIGLCGVMALMPLAHQQANLAVITDRVTMLGKSAFRDFRIRGMGPQGLPQSGGAWVSTNWVTLTGPNAAGPVYLVPSSITPQSRESFCLDPLFLDMTSSFVPPPAGVNQTRFPYVATGGVGPTMQRVTLGSVNLNSGGAQPIHSLLADEIFRAHDDLVTEPSSENNPPIQVDANGMKWNDPQFIPPTSPPFKRQTAGDYSWMATIVPQIGSDLWTVSIVVFHRRHLTLAPPDPSNPSAPVDTGMLTIDALVPNVPVDAVAERVVNLQFVDGLGGGAAMISSPYERALEVREGDWLMAAAVIPNTTPAVNFFRWYRVIAAERVNDTSSGTPLRHVTLHGPDWAAQLSAQATIVQGVVSVYEKTMRLEGTSLWTP